MNTICLAILLTAGCGIFTSAFGQLPSTGAFEAAYTVLANDHPRSAVPSPTSIVGGATFGVNLAPRFLIIANTKTFVSTDTPGSGRTTGYGTTKLEFNGDIVHKERSVETGILNRDFALDYTITFPTDGSSAPGIEAYAHQFLATYAFDYSPRTSFEIDTGDYMGGRDAKPGYKHTGLLSLIAERNAHRDGNSPLTLDLELDASPSSEGAPASVVATTGFTYKFHTNYRLSVEALTGITANDPEIGVSVTLKFKGNLGKKKESKPELSFARLRRLERDRPFGGRLGRF